MTFAFIWQRCITVMPMIHSDISVGRQSYVFSGSRYIVLVMWKLSKWWQAVLTSLLWLALILASLVYKISVNELCRVEGRSAGPEKTANSKISSLNYWINYLMKHGTTASPGTCKQWRMAQNSTYMLLHSQSFLYKCKDETHVIFKDK